MSPRHHLRRSCQRIQKCGTGHETKIWSFDCDRVPPSPQLDEPVEDKEDEAAEEQHVAQQLGLTASGELLDAADGGAQQATRRVKVRVLECEGGIGEVQVQPGHHTKHPHHPLHAVISESITHTYQILLDLF